MNKSVQLGDPGFRMVESICFRLLPVQILLALAGAVNGTISSLFATNCVGAEAMSAIGLYDPIRQFFCAIAVMLMGGSQILCGKYMGKNQISGTQRIFSLNIALSALIGLAVTVLLVVAAAFDLTGMFTEDAHIRRYFNQYMLGTSVGIFPQILNQQLAAFLSLENQGKRTTAASVVYVAANLVLNYIFVVKLHMETIGLALASSLGLWIMFAVQAAYYFGDKSILKYSRKSFRWRDSKDMIVTGIPSALNSGYLVIRGLVVNTVILSCVGAVGLSAFASSNALLGFFWAIPPGMLAVSRMLISVSVGEEDRKSVLDIMRVVCRRFVPIMAGVALLLSLFAVPLTHLYYSDPASDIFRMTVWGFRILPICMPLSVVFMHFICYGQTFGNHLFVHTMSVIEGALTVIVFSVLLTPVLGINGIYIANVLNGIVAILAVVIFAWIRNGKMPRTMEELLMMPKSFGVSEQDRIDFSAHSMQQVINLSVKVSEFCKSKGIDPRRSYFASLAVEEMLGNIVEHGFVKDKKHHTADIRIAYKNNTLILRFKDDCIPFDPAERSNIVDPKDPTKNIGIRMVYSLAKDISYQNILGMNALMIKF